MRPGTPFLQSTFLVANRNSIRGFVRPSVGWSVGRAFFFLRWKTQVCLINVFQSLKKVNILILRPTHADTQTHLHARNTHALDSQLLVACRPCFQCSKINVASVSCIMQGPSVDILRTPEKRNYLQNYNAFLFFLFKGDSNDDDYSYRA